MKLDCKLRQCFNVRVMKIMTSFDTEFEARRELANMNCNEITESKAGVIFRQEITMEFFLMKHWQGRWEIQRPTITKI